VTTLVVLDGTNLARRAFHAGGRVLVVPTAERVKRLIPDAKVVAAWDSPGPGWRHRLWPDYKAHRGHDPEAMQAVKDEQARARAAGIPGRVATDFEADDVAATLIAHWEGDAAFVSADKDWSQLLDYGARWFVPAPGGLEERDATWLWDRYGVTPGAWPEFAALAGDSSDGIPGVRGIGPKRAAQLIAAHGILARVIAGDVRVGAEAHKALVFARLTALRTDAPVRPS
jgi:5'-3' exonuclease